MTIRKKRRITFELDVKKPPPRYPAQPMVVPYCWEVDGEVTAVLGVGKINSALAVVGASIWPASPSYRTRRKAPMGKFKPFAPSHLADAVKRSGFFQCRTCGLVWFGKPERDFCPDAPHGDPVHVAMLCRSCDAEVPIEHLADHLQSEQHRLCAREQ